MKAVMWRATLTVLAVAALLSYVPGARAQGAAASDAEAHDWDELAKSDPATFALCKQGEAAFRAGDLTSAFMFYGRARGASSANVVPARGACRVALARGMEADARLTCQRAFMLGGNARDMRNTVAAIMGVTTRPAMSELASASLLADGAVRSAPSEPWGYLARCDIAARLGDRRALDACVADLRRVAPEHEETLRMVAASIAPATPWIWLGRCVLGLGLLATLLHALSRRSRGGRGRSAALSTAALASLTAVAWISFALTSCRPALALPSANFDRLSNYKIDDTNPEASIPSLEKQNKDPMEFGYLLQDLLAKAQEATKRRDHKAAARYYHALTVAVPSRAYPYGRACEAYEAAGDRPHALEACRDALSREGTTVADYSHLVVLTLAQKEPLTREQIKELNEVLDHLSSEPEAAVVAHRLRCDVALRLHDVPALEACTKALVASVPDEPKTISFQWALALEKHDGGQARALIDRARKAGVPQEGLAKMEAATTRAVRTRVLKLALLGLGVLLAGGLILFASRRAAASRRSLATSTSSAS